MHAQTRYAIIHTSMASRPGILTDWPWKSLGNFKYLILAPWVIHSTYTFIVKGEKERDLAYFLTFPFLLLRILHNQIWISLSRYLTARGTRRIVDKGMEFEQIDRESNWDDQIILTAIVFYMVIIVHPWGSHMPLWETNGVLLTILLHTGPVEFLYYWFHRLLHHHYLYSRYHSHHHSSIVTQPITSVIHPFAEIIVYFMLFSIPLLAVVLTRRASLAATFGYVVYIDFMNNMGHCNFEFIPNCLFSIFPPLKFFMYTPSFHSLHHTQFRTNYCLFMPIYDYIYNTVDKSSDILYTNSLKRPQESPNVVHLTHLTTLDSIYHLPFVFASLASRPQLLNSTWHLWVICPLTWTWYKISTWFHAHKFTADRILFDKVASQAWYLLKGQRETINNLIEEAVMEADEKGIKVVSLGLLNQGKELNNYGELYIQKHPTMKTKLVDGSSLVVALVVNSVPIGTTQVLLKGHPTKTACAIASALCRRDIQVAEWPDKEYNNKLALQNKNGTNVVLGSSYNPKVWLIGDGMEPNEQLKAPKGTLFIPFVPFPPRRLRKDCFYHNTPAMVTPKSFENMHSCENWLPRRAMSAWRVAGIVHALEEWDVHECGDTMFEIDKVWKACLRHGFLPLSSSAQLASKGK